MKKRVFSIILSLCMVVTLLPMAALAAELPEAGENGTITISESMDLTDVNITGEISVYEAPLLSITGDAVVTINGGTISLGSSTQGFAINVSDNAQLTLTNVNVTGYHAAIRVQDNAKLTVDGGSLTATQTTSAAGDVIRAYGSSTVTIKNNASLTTATGSGAAGTGVELYQSSKVNVEGAEINGWAGIYVYGGTLDVDDVTINATEAGIGVSGNIPANSNIAGARSITVNGGTITSAGSSGADSGAVTICASAGNAGGTTEVALTGGTYRGAIQNKVDNATHEADLAISGGTFTDLGTGDNNQPNTIEDYLTDGLTTDNDGKVVPDRTDENGNTIGEPVVDGDLTVRGDNATSYTVKNLVVGLTYTIQMTKDNEGVFRVSFKAAEDTIVIHCEDGNSVLLLETALPLTYDDGVLDIDVTNGGGSGLTIGE